MCFPIFSDLRSSFETPPYSQQIQLGSQAVLRCHPPKGVPEASVAEWLKDGAMVDQTTDPNFIHSSDGHLLIIQARMEDSANYTCVARNSAGLERISPSATIKVYGIGSILAILASLAHINPFRCGSAAASNFLPSCRSFCRFATSPPGRPPGIWPVRS
jgi:hypothetical protein